MQSAEKVDNFIDLSDKKTEDSNREKMATIGELTSKLAHDLRNPISVLKTTHEIMKQQPNLASEKREMYNSKIDRSIQKIIHIVDDVLDFVRISALKIEPVSLSSLIASAIDTIDIPDGVSINTPTNDFTVNCDFRKMEAVIVNILTNAVQAVEKDGTVQIRLTPKEKSIAIEIEDDGPGISESDILKIFDPLFTTKPIGTGLGLAICKSIVDQHGGKIFVSSKPTVFHILLPQ